ncbi:MAG TPA: hypothetical protein VND21_03295, partial [Planctomycetota bacterium]|nr:hypothetical protein [Planctomycetota bacterium]
AYHLLEARDCPGAAEAMRLAWDSEEYAFTPLGDDGRDATARFARIRAVRPRFICVNDDLPDDAGDDHPSLRAFTDWMAAAYQTPSRFERPISPAERAR